MADFNKAIELVLKNEGGLVNDSSDSGEITKFGISKKSYPNEDIVNLSLERAKKIYKRDYWDKVWGDDINSQVVANSIMDFAVNAGVGTCIKLVQNVVKSKSDGLMGTNTIAAINHFDEKLFVPLFIIEKIKLYIGICNKRPENKKFFFGWINRSINN